MPDVLVAPDKFKGSLTARQVGAAVARGIGAVRPDLDVAVVPVADGGDGTLSAAVAAGFEWVPVLASGPTGGRVQTGYARRGDLAVVELADVSGLGRLPDRVLHPMTATSRGTGEVLGAAVDAGCRQVVLAVGGSASTDGGAGMVQALGGRLLDRERAPVGPGGGALSALATLDVEPMRERLAGVQVVLASDVGNPLTGTDGAAHVYGPQKGADDDQVRALDTALGHWADLVAETTGHELRDAEGAGAAGGVGFAALALAGARMRSGIDLVLELVGLDEWLSSGVRLVVTGEGSLDEQSLAGKAPVGVAAAAREHGVPVVAVCGRSTLDSGRLADAGIDAAYALRGLEPDPAASIADADRILERLAADIAADWLAGSEHRACDHSPAHGTTSTEGDR